MYPTGSLRSRKDFSARRWRSRTSATSPPARRASAPSSPDGAELFDYFGADSCVQLTVVNRPIPAEEIGTKSFFPTDDPQTAAYAEEYNRILNDKMREGVSNLVRERYLTFAVGAPPSTRRSRGSPECAGTPSRPSPR